MTTSVRAGGCVHSTVQQKFVAAAQRASRTFGVLETPKVCARYRRLRNYARLTCFIQALPVSAHSANAIVYNSKHRPRCSSSSACAPARVWGAAVAGGSRRVMSYRAKRWANFATRRWFPYPAPSRSSLLGSPRPQPLPLPVPPAIRGSIFPPSPRNLQHRPGRFAHRPR